MNVSVVKKSKTEVKLEISADEQQIADVKRQVFNELRKNVKAKGFREGKAPDNIVEQELGAQTVQAEVLNAAVSRLYGMAVTKEKLQTLGKPELKLKKFVPYSELEFEVDVEVVPDIKLADYKKIKVPLKVDEVTDKDVKDVLERLRKSVSDKKEVKRAAAEGDEVWIDFEGKDSKGKEIRGASGQDYPLNIGSKTFIPGFEEEMTGLKPGDEKEFTLTFPKDYHAKNLAGQKVTFNVKVNKVKSVTLPKLDDEFASKVGPFSSLKDLKSDIKSQIKQERENQAKSKQREEILAKIVEKSNIPTPSKLVEDVAKSIKEEFVQNLSYRGMTFDDYLKQIGQSAEEFNEKEVKPQAEKRAKTSLVLSKIAEEEDITANQQELEQRLELMKSQYKDNQDILREIDSPQSRQDIASQILTEKTIERIMKYAGEQ